MPIHILARKAGLRAEEFTFVAVGSPNTAYPTLVSKQVDAAMSFEPLGTRSLFYYGPDIAKAEARLRALRRTLYQSTSAATPWLYLGLTNVYASPPDRKAASTFFAIA
jgi:hypothetical protein